MRETPLRFFFVVSGEHPTLPTAELVAILETLGVSYRVTGTAYKLVEIEANADRTGDVAKRGGFIEEAGIEILHSAAGYDEIAHFVKAAPLDHYLSPAESFSVRVARYGEDSDGIPRVKLESLVGGLIAEKTRARVNLKTPHKLFRGILAGGDFHFGLLTYQRPKGSIANRRPRKRPVFHPSTMVPKLARCMVNLSHAKEGELFLDPFCGVGGILIEACLVGSQVVGMDALTRMLRGAGRNLAHFGFAPLGLVRGDARNLPVSRVDAIATDPPYGTGASTLKSTTREILKDFLPQARNVLKTGNRAVIASPAGTGASHMAEASGFKVLDRHQVYVHRSLTREILVLGAV